MPTRDRPTRDGTTLDKPPGKTPEAPADGWLKGDSENTDWLLSDDIEAAREAAKEEAAVHRRRLLPKP